MGTAILNKANKEVDKIQLTLVPLQKPQDKTRVDIAA